MKKVGLQNHNWPRQFMKFIIGNGPFPFYLFRFGKHPEKCCACGEPGTPFHYATKFRLTFSYHLRCPADQHTDGWIKSITKLRLLTNKITDLLNLTIIQEDLFKSGLPEKLHNSLHCSSHYKAHVSHHAFLFLSPGTFHARDRSSDSVSQGPATCSCSPNV
ncbi:hypothetical protein AVEN_257252-1 [Araneus ventricosus]|uniref:Uncharacterized protein n=1 Tax=Araneus ventricosus TaxID=182803 RepID=A0A4Y2NIH5_ARAVE|nr:hypothetical protein AVEN_257252-1 [Araneus ventricosus]